MTVENQVNKTSPQVMGSSFTYDFVFDVLIKDPTEQAAKEAIKVSVSDGTTTTPLTYGTDYTVALNASGIGGTVTVADKRTSDYSLIVYREYDCTQGSDYNNYNAFPAETLERNLDKLTMITQQLAEETERSVKVDMFSDTDPDFFGKEIEALYAIKDDITTDAQNISSITAVSGNATNINTVAGSIANVNAVGGSIANVNAVAGDLTNVDTVATYMSSVRLCADDITNVNAVGVNINDVIDVAGIKNDVSTVAGIKNDVSAVASIDDNVSTVSGISADVSTVAGIDDEVTAVANNAANINAVNANKNNINTVAGISSSVTTVAGIASDVTAVANNATNINTVAGSISNVNTVAGSISNVNSVAGDLTNIDAVAADLTNIDAAPTYATNANIWAEGTDAQVQALGGTHSAKGWAESTGWVTLGTTQTLTGDKTFKAGLIVDNDQPGSVNNASVKFSSNGTLKGYLTYSATDDAFVFLDSSLYQATLRVKTQAATDSSDKAATTKWVNTTGNNIVHLNSTETLTGAKTFGGTINIDNNFTGSGYSPAIKFSSNGTVLGYLYNYAANNEYAFSDSAYHLSTLRVKTQDATDNSNNVATTQWVNTTNKTGRGIGAPNYGGAQSVSIDSTTPFTATENGWIQGDLSSVTIGHLSIDGSVVAVADTAQNYYHCHQAFVAPIAKGSVATYDQTTGITVKFVPCK